MAEGIQSMGIPNVCVIRGGTPDAEYRKQFKDVKRIAWNLSGGSNESYRALKDYVFGLRETTPNLPAIILTTSSALVTSRGLTRSPRRNLPPLLFPSMK